MICKITLMKRMMMYYNDRKKELDTLINITQWANKERLTPATGGNFSIRYDDQACLVTASGVDKGSLDTSHFIKVDWQQSVLAGEGSPSAETGIHTCLYELDTHIVSVCHTHSLSATVLSRLTTDDWLYINGWEMQKTQSGIKSHESRLSLAVFDNDQNITCLADEIKARWAIQPLQHGILIRGHGLYSWSYAMDKAQMNLEGLIFLLYCELAKQQLEQR